MFVDKKRIIYVFVPLYICQVKCGPDPRAVPEYVSTSGESLDDSDGLLMSLLYSHVTYMLSSLMWPGSEGGSWRLNAR